MGDGNLRRGDPSAAQPLPRLALLDLKDNQPFAPIRRERISQLPLERPCSSRPTPRGRPSGARRQSEPRGRPSQKRLLGEGNAPQSSGDRMRAQPLCSRARPLRPLGPAARPPAARPMPDSTLRRCPPADADHSSFACPSPHTPSGLDLCRHARKVAAHVTAEQPSGTRARGLGPESPDGQSKSVPDSASVTGAEPVLRRRVSVRHFGSLRHSEVASDVVELLLDNV